MLQLSAAHKVAAAKRTDDVFLKAAGLLGLTADEAWNKATDLLRKSRRVLNGIDPTGLVL